MQLPDAEQLLARLVTRIKPDVTPETAMVGIYTGGAWLAERLHQALGIAVPLGTLDISFYRDDYSKTGLHPQVKPSKIPFEVENRHILLVDDVLYTGRTIRGAMNELFDYGRPAKIHLIVAVDRGERQLPICPQYVGADLSVPHGHMLRLAREDGGRLAFRLTAASSNA
jgi:pyrimidine operon attenuation protein/uracil phosphoribosyltransferase